MRLERNRPPRPSVIRAIWVIAAISYFSALIGDVLLAEVFDRYPLVLMAMNPRIRVMALVSNQVAAWQFFIVGFARLVVMDPIYYLLGFWYGDRALAWVKRRSRTYGQFADDAVPFFRKWSLPLIFFAPNTYVCMLAGAAGVTVQRFLTLNVAGTIWRLVMIRLFASYFSDGIEDVSGFISGNRRWILLISAAAVAWTLFGEFRGNESEISSLRDLTEPSDQANREDPSDPSRD